MDRPAPSRPCAPRRPGELRLVGGRWRRRRLPVPTAPGLRPTPDRVRETLFNWLGQVLDGWRVLDAFAGTGALGLEAASRGAARVELLEHDRRLAAGLRATVRSLGAEAEACVQVQAADALAWMRQAPPGGYDLILLDPPFGLGLDVAALQAATGLLAPGGWLYLEAERELPPAALAGSGLALHRRQRAGAVHAQLLRRPGPDEATAYTASPAPGAPAP